MFVEDLSPFFGDLAVDATLNGAAVRGIFDAAYSAGEVGPMGIASTQPMLTLPTSSVPDSPVGKTAVVSGVNYLIAAHEPDGTGLSTLMLELA